MSASRAARVFASVDKQQPSLKTKPSNQADANPNVAVEHVQEDMSKMKPSPESDNTITVCATGELSLPPDRCKVLITMSSKKDNVQDVKNSVARRVDYIKQTLHNHHVKEGDITISKSMTRVDTLYLLSAEILVLFVDASKCEGVCNFLVEKLDESVKVSAPEFLQGPQRLENLRRQASLLAVNNAKQKATEIAKFLHSSAGKAIAVSEQAQTEWEGSNDVPYDPEMQMTVQQRRDQATINVKVTVKATFELQSKVRTNVKT